VHHQAAAPAGREELSAPQQAMVDQVVAGLDNGFERGPLPETSVKFRTVERILRDPARRDAFVGQRWLGLSIVTLACLLLFLGATGKSAQIPLFTWLPDAMAGPTPVSALIHAATMVTAGVYLVARLHFVFALSPVAMTVVATIGAATALFAATIGLFQYDIKKVLAYSTISQLGFMFVAVGVGAYWVGIFHLVTHAFFKACLFLGSGSVILGCHHEQDMRKMGGLWKLMPVTAFTYLLSCCAIAGFPFFSGFFSKDEILWKVFDTGNVIYRSGGFWLYVVAAAAALCTSFYMFRSFFMTFTGKYRGAAHAEGHGGPPKESPLSMTAVLAILATLAVVGGFVGMPHILGLFPNWFERFLEPVFAGSEHLLRWRGHSAGFEWGLMGTSIVIALLGFGLAWWLYNEARNPLPARLLASRNPVVRGVHALIYNKYYVDRGYGFVFVDGGLGLSRFLAWGDTWVVDGLVNLAGWIGKVFGFLQGWIDRWFVDGAVNLVGDAIVRSGRSLRRVQSGRIQSYIYGLVLGSVTLVVVVYVVPW
jgi:NADH-quinone oxidoreductase subunit L